LIVDDSPPGASNIAEKMIEIVMAGAADPTSSGAPPSLGRRVLLVDDDSDHSALLKEVLEGAGHEVHAVETADAALLEVESFRPEFAIIDIGLPGMDGYELARRVRSIAACRLIALSGYSANSAPPDTAVTSFDHHFVKPFDHTRLLRTIATA
jgi:CheY-like chemotaxis protein